MNINAKVSAFIGNPSICLEVTYTVISNFHIQYTEGSETFNILHADVGINH